MMSAGGPARDGSCLMRAHVVSQGGWTLFKEEEGMQTELHIEGMHCDSCAVDIKETLEETAGVFKADVTFKRKTAIVDFDDNVVQQTTLLKKIQDLGYTATVSGQSQSEVGA
jgi:periplasmic mercuric ion binding protein